VKQHIPTPSATIQTIRAAGARATPARVRVLDLLRGASRALSHQEIELSLGDALLDRVTLYRVLDWLVEAGLAHKSVDARRVSRFSAAEVRAHHESHAHFRCDTCGRVFCLDSVQPAIPRVPRGFRVGQVDLSVRGECAQCAQGE
jgi:Fur family ferric uptake transcriptional regulator